MKLYLVSRTDQIEYDEYDAFVVSARNEDEAVEICYKASYYHISFSDKDNLKIEEISNKTNEPQGVVLGSFNAG